MQFKATRKFLTSLPFKGKWTSPTYRNITTVQRGSRNTTSFRLYFCNENGPISSFHDIPLRATNSDPGTKGVMPTFNMIVEIPRWSNAKMEIATKEPLNPIKQDTKNGKLRFASNCFPHHGYIWNYGALPQTWENPHHVDPVTKCKGDNDPIDVLEIGSKIHKIGALVTVKILGCFCVLDEGETDWKLLGIDVTDPLCNILHDIKDIETNMPGFLKESKKWFQMYKIPSGSPANKLAFGGAPKDSAFAHNVIEETKRPMNSGVLCLEKKLVPILIRRISPHFAHRDFVISVEEAKKFMNIPPKPGEPGKVDPYVDKWHYVKIE